MHLRNLIREAQQYRYFGHQLFQLGTNEQGAEVVTVFHGVPITMVSRSDSAGTGLGHSQLLLALPRPVPPRMPPGWRPPSSDISRTPSSLLTCAVAPPWPSAQEAAFDAHVQVNSYPSNSAECSFGGVQSRPLLMGGAGTPVMDAVPVPL